MGFLIALSAFVVALGALVIIHEGGHYLAALSVGVRVLRFSVGFGPVLLRRTTKGGTEFAVSALPLGGYVKMLDSRDPECAEECARHPEGNFENKKLWQRAWVVFAGPLMISYFMPGANFRISFAQLYTREEGHTIRVRFRFFHSPSIAMTWSVFPRPISSASRAPKPRSRRLQSHEKPFR